MKLSPSLSAYLDFLRFGAALTVMFGHMGHDGFNISWMPVGHLYHEAVIVFFVMSGFIIYTSTARQPGGGRDYLIARASRVYSVAIPAIAFSVVLSLALGAAVESPTKVAGGYREFSGLDILGSLLFINESWRSTAPHAPDLTLNGPYWSLCYEVWYYVIFGLFSFVKGRARWPLLVLACIVAGPAILVLFPLWCLGAWLAARHSVLPDLPRPAAWLLFVGAPVLVVAIKLSGADESIKNALHDSVSGFWRLSASQKFLTDYVIGIAVAAHIYAYGHLGDHVRELFARWRAPLSALAGFSFTLYLFHRPMTDIAGGLIPPQHQTVALSMLASLAFVLVCWLASFVTERQLPRWRQAMRRLLPSHGLAAAATPSKG